MLISKCHLMGPFRAFLKPMGPQSPWAPGSLYPLPPLSVALLSSTHWCVLYIYCPSTSLPCVTTVTGLAVLYVPVVGYQNHTRLTLTVK